MPCLPAWQALGATPTRSSWAASCLSVQATLAEALCQYNAAYGAALVLQETKLPAPSSSRATCLLRERGQCLAAGATISALCQACQQHAAALSTRERGDVEEGPPANGMKRLTRRIRHMERRLAEDWAAKLCGMGRPFAT